MGKQLRVGVIGCGGIANEKHLPALKSVPEADLAAFCDIVPERAEKAMAGYGSPGAKIYTDYRRLLEDKTIDVVHVLTPNLSHAEITVASLEAGKHVMCEKPMAINSAGAKKMLDASRATGKKLTIGYHCRFRPNSVYLKQACDSGELGEIYYAKAHAVRRRAVPTWGVFLDKRQQGGGPLIDIGTHALDLTLWCMNNYSPKMAVGSVFHKLGHQTETANAWGDWDPSTFDVEDSAFGFVVMENGATIVLESSWALNTLQTGEAMTTLCGTLAGADMVDGLRINRVAHNRQLVEKPDFDAGGAAFYAGARIEPHFLEARLWFDSILNDTEVQIKPEEALVVTQILEAIYESAETGRPVFFK